MRWAILGAGGAGMGHARQVLATDGLELAGLCDTDVGVAEARAAELGTRAFPSLEALLADQSVDGVTVATPSALHVEHAVALLDAGKHVLIEKPFALDGAGAERIAAAAGRAGRLALPYHNRRWDPDFRLVLDAVRSGVLGDVRVVRSTVGGPSPDSGWRLLRAWGGGRLNDWGPHLFSQVCEWFGPEPLSLSGFTTRVNPENECDDLFAADFVYAPGVRVSVMMSGFSHLPSPRWEVLGSEGTLLLAGNIHGEFTLHWKRRDGREFEQAYRRQEVAPPVPIYRGIVGHLRDGAPLPVALKEGVTVSRWLERVRG